MTFKIKGTDDMRAVLRQVAKEAPKQLKAALYQEAQILMTESKRRCPIAPDGGALRASGFVSKPELVGTTVSVVMSYGGAAEEYAIAVHEHLSAHSPPSWLTSVEGGRLVHWTTPGTGPKFLESVINEVQPMLLQRVGARIKF